MSKFYLFFLLLQASSCGEVRHISNTTMYKTAKDYIVSNDLAKDYATELYGSAEIVPYISSELIPYNFISVSVDVISKNYIEGFSPFNEISKDEIRVVDQVTDSLSNLDKIYKQKYEEKEYDWLTELSENTTDHNFIIFFSEMREGMLYVELLPYNAKLFKVKKRATVQYGKALSFLIFFNENREIKQVYQGDIHYN